MNIYKELHRRLVDLLEDADLLDRPVGIGAGALTPEQALGLTQRKDYPLLQGKEVLVEAQFQGHKGQAYTSQPSAFSGTLAQVLELDLADSRNRPLFIASLNAVLAALGVIEGTVHCRGEELEGCGEDMARELAERFGSGAKVGLVGLQPGLVAHLSPGFSLRVLDLNPENVGTTLHGVLIEDGATAQQDVADWADVLLVTGSTLSNGSITWYLQITHPPVIYFGTTIAGAAYLLDLERLCPRSS